MKIALFGYGKMGKKIEAAAFDRGHSVCARFTSSLFDEQLLKEADLCIDFSVPEAVVDHVRLAATHNKEIVIGTTGWLGHIDTVKTIALQHSIGLLYSPNFSIGVYLFKKIAAYAASLFDPFAEYDSALIELHHNAKKDAPSGTALQLAQSVEAEMKRVEKLPIASLRCGSAPGKHTLLFDSPCDSLSITHEARNREGFALGAVHAAEWLIGRKGVYSFDDYMEQKH